MNGGEQSSGEEGGETERGRAETPIEIPLLVLPRGDDRAQHRTVIPLFSPPTDRRERVMRRAGKHGVK